MRKGVSHYDDILWVCQVGLLSTRAEPSMAGHKPIAMSFPWFVMPRLHESGPFQGSYGQPREPTQHLLGPIELLSAY